MKQTLKNINWVNVAKILLTLVIALTPVLIPESSSAQLNRGFQCDPSSGLNCNGGNDINSFIRTIINWMLGVAFGIAVLFVIIGGFWYVTSAGNEETAEKGRNTVVNAVIGIVIIILSYVIVNVVSSLVSRTTV